MARPSLGLYAPKVDHDALHELLERRQQSDHYGYTAIPTSVLPSLDIRTEKYTHIGVYLDRLVADQEVERSPIPEIMALALGHGIKLAVMTPEFTPGLTAHLKALPKAREMKKITLDARVNVTALDRSIVRNVIPWLLGRTAIKSPGV